MYLPIEVEYSRHVVPRAGPFWIATPRGVDDLNCRGIRAGWLFDVSVHYVVRRLGWRDTFVDVGASLGTFAIPAALKCRRVLAIEPLPETYVLLCRSALKNGLSNLTVVHCAALEQAGTISMVKDGMCINADNGGGDVQVSALALQDIFALHGIGRIKILKIDIEGFELPALRGMERVLCSGEPEEILFEVYDDRCRMAGYSGDELLSYLAGHGYHLYQIYADCGGLLSPLQPGDFRELSCNNYLASRRRLRGFHGGLKVAKVPQEIVLAYALDHAKSRHDIYRAHIAAEVRRAPSWLRHNAQFRTAIAALESDPVEDVRNAYKTGQS